MTAHKDVNTIDNKITQAEAKRLACPSHIIAAGANASDCMCVENTLFNIGQKPGAVKYDGITSRAGAENEQGKRDIAIGILRLEAFEICGLLDPNHKVSRNLHAPNP